MRNTLTAIFLVTVATVCHHPLILHANASDDEAYATYWWLKRTTVLTPTALRETLIASFTFTSCFPPREEPSPWTKVLRFREDFGVADDYLGEVLASIYLEGVAIEKAHGEEISADNREEHYNAKMMQEHSLTWLGGCVDPASIRFLHTVVTNTAIPPEIYTIAIRSYMRTAPPHKLRELLFLQLIDYPVDTNKRHAICDAITIIYPDADPSRRLDIRLAVQATLNHEADRAIFQKLDSLLIRWDNNYRRSHERHALCQQHGLFSDPSIDYNPTTHTTTNNSILKSEKFSISASPQQRLYPAEQRLMLLDTLTSKSIHYGLKDNFIHAALRDVNAEEAKHALLSLLTGPDRLAHRHLTHLDALKCYNESKEPAMRHAVIAALLAAVPYEDDLGTFIWLDQKLAERSASYCYSSQRHRILKRRMKQPYGRYEGNSYEELSQAYNKSKYQFRRTTFHATISDVDAHDFSLPLSKKQKAQWGGELTDPKKLKPLYYTPKKEKPTLWRRIRNSIFPPEDRAATSHLRQ